MIVLHQEVKSQAVRTARVLWMDNKQQDLKQVDMKRHREKAKNSEDGTSVLRETRGKLKGL